MVKKELLELNDIIKNELDSKQSSLLLQWVNTWNIYIKNESSFKPHLNRKYNKKEIITVALGYNVGSEQGGNRPAVVIEDNDRSNKTVTIVPLASIDKASEPLNKSSVFLGEIPQLNVKTRKPIGTSSKALVGQIRTVSKQRIIRPKKNKDDVIEITDTQLELIKNKIKELYID